MNVTHPPTRVPGCPETFEAEPTTMQSLSAFDQATVDNSGQWPTIDGQLAAQGVALTSAQWAVLAGAALANPDWTPTYDRIVLGNDGKPIDANDPEQVATATTEHQVAACPNCGTPIKVV